MPLKFNKEVSTQLFKYVSTIDLKFNRKLWSLGDDRSLDFPRENLLSLFTHHHAMTSIAMDNRTTSVRELLRQLRAKRFTKANPKLAINVDVHNRPASPSAHFKFVDGTDVSCSATVIIVSESVTYTRTTLSSQISLCFIAIV